jgi:hypothetical protein
MPTVAPRRARILLTVHSAVALLMTLLPPPFPVHFPELRVPLWLGIAVVAGGLALLSSRPHTPRSVVLALGWAQLLLTLVNAIPVGDIAALFGTWLSVSALALLAGQLRKRPRKALVAAHVISSASWVGIGVVFVALSVVALTTSDIHSAQVTYELMETFDQTLLPWANFAATLTGIALGLTTKWGLVRYWWVAIKLAISVTVLVMAFGFLHDAVVAAAEQAAHLAATGGTVAQIDGHTDVVFWGFTTALFSLLAAMLLSLYKPGGRTPLGRRAQAVTRRRPVTSGAARPDVA